MNAILRGLMFASISLIAVLSTPPALADEIRLRQDCGAELPPQCFETLAEVLEEIHVPSPGRALPGPANPVVVDIGSGVFPLTSTAYPYCDGLDHITFRGTGKHTTVLTGGGFPAQGWFLDLFAPYAVLVRNCFHVEFQHLGIKTQEGVSNSGIRFAGAGGTAWTDVWIGVRPESFTIPIAWLDAPLQAGDEQEHYWDGVEAEVEGSNPSGFWISESKHSFVGSTIDVKSDGGNIYGAIFGTGTFDLTIRGSRLVIDDRATTEQTQAAVVWMTGQIFYPSCENARAFISGSQIQARSTTSHPGSWLTGIYNACTDFAGTARERGSVYELVAAAGAVRRIDGPIDAPYALGSGANPPPWVSSQWSLKGQDTFVETDCSAGLCADTPQGTDSHLLSFDPACATAGPWFDTHTGRCRGL